MSVCFGSVFNSSFSAEMVDDHYYDLSYNVSTQGNTKIIKIKWTILDFKRLLEENSDLKITDDKYLKQHVSEDSKFKLRIEKSSATTGDVVKLYFAPATLPIVYVKANLYTRHSGSRTCLASTDYTWSTKKIWTFLKEQSKQDILDSLYYSCLALEFQFYVLTKPYNEDPFEVEPIPPSLKNDLGSMLTKSTLSDVTIKSAEGVELSAHKNILIVRSPVFKANFEHGTKESLTNIIDSPFEVEVLQELLQYIYTDNVLKINEMAEQLLMAADFYQLDALKHLSEKELVKKLSIENAIQTLMLADQYSAKNLKRITLKFIHEGRLEDVKKTSAYEALQSVDILKAILE